MEELPRPEASVIPVVSTGTREEAGAPGHTESAVALARERALFDTHQGTILVSEVRDLAAFDAMASEWNGLVARTDDQVFYRHEFLRCWLRHFAPEARLRILT